MLRRVHSIIILFALLVGSAGINYVQAAKVVLTVRANNGAYGKVRIANNAWSGTNGQVQIATTSGTSVQISAQANTGYRFSKWNDNNTSATRTIKVPTTNTTYTATFVVATYTLTVSSNNTNYGTVTGGGTYNHGASATLTATPKTGYHFVQWSDGNTNATRTISNITANATYTATFAINTYTLTVTSNNTNYGTVTGGGTYNHGATANLTATPKTGYHFVKWSDNNTNASRSITVTAAATYTATFAINTYTITATSANTSMGTVTGGGTYNYGASATLTATPKTGYHFVKWSDNVTSATRTISNIKANATYTATFAINTYTITFKNGNTTLQTLTVNHGVKPSYTGSTPTKAQTAQYTYTFSGWSPTVVAATANATYTAQFSSTLRKYTITVASNNSEMGYAQMTYIDPVSQGTSTYANTSHAFNYGDQLTLTAYPSDCAHFVKWSDNSTEKTRTVTVTGTKTYTATFAADTYSGTCGAAGNEANVQWSLNMCTLAFTITGTGDMMNYSGSNAPWYPYRGFITSVTIANSVTSIGNYAFYYCSNMKSVSMGTGVTSIGDYAFYECNNLTSITIGNHVTSIGSSAFLNCSRLTSITIPPSVTSIRNNAFYGCNAMESLYITNLAAWCNISFGSSSSSPFARNNYYNSEGGGNLYVNGTKVTTLTIPNGITEIPDYAFLGFAGITDIQFNQTKTIGDFAFACCLGVTNVTIPEGVTTIGNNAFAYCPHMLSMSIPVSVTSLGSSMMYNCQALTDIYVPWTEDIPVWPSSFTSKSPQSSITLHVPTCMQTLYTGGWANYTIDGETEDRAVSIATNNATYGLVQYNDETPVPSIEKQLSCITTFTVTAVPAEGCHFVEWSDGLIYSTRQISNLSNDTALTALFGPGVPPEIYDDQAGTLQQGALSGAFSVSATQVVYFSRGPLQFNSTLGTHECADGTTKPGTWRFAEHQYDVVGDLSTGNVYENGVKCSNNLASATYTGWQDMYCWGASGYNGIEPYKANRPSTTSIAGTNYDWGVYNAISNGGNTPGLWRTPTRTEWDYMFNQRPNAKQLNAPAVVEGMYGLVVLPDDWEAPVGLNLVTNSTQYYTDNVFTAAQWQEMENAGAVFIPGGGWFSWGSNTWGSHFANTGELWASTGSSTSSQHDVQWGNDRQAYLSASSTHVLEQLRLVSDFGGYTKVRFVGIDSHGDKFVIAYIYVPYGATPVPPEVPERECYTFAGWDRTITPVTGRVTTYTAQYEDLIYSGTCGADGDNLTWTLNACDSTLIISGTGAMANYPALNMPWKDYRTSITSVIISDGVTTIGAYAFSGCSHLTSLTVPSSLTSVGQNAFTSCWAMESVYISDLEAWCNIDFGTYDSSPFSRNGYLIYVGGGDLYVNGTKVTTLTIPDGVTEIKNHAFYGFAGITSIDFNQVTSIGNEAFNGCHGLSEVTIPEGVTAIGQYGFSYCSHLQSISIPASVSSLGTSMLAANNMLTDIHVHWTENIPAWPENFTKKNPQSSITLHIPCAAIELYQDADGWKDYTIEGEGGPFTVTVQAEDPIMGDVSITVNP